MSEIFMPLRSNAGWFTSRGTHAALEKRLKNLLIIYDRVILQDGQYTASVWPDGCFAMMTPAQSCGFDRTVLRLPEPSHEPTLLIKSKDETSSVIFAGKAAFNCVADFVPILHSNQLSAVDGLILEDGDLSSGATSEAKGAAKEDVGKHRKELEPLIPSVVRSPFLLPTLLESVYVDLRIGHATGRALSIDAGAASLLEWGGRSWVPDARPLAHESMIHVGIPDFGDEPWDEVLRVRESSAGRDYRTTLERIANRAGDALAEDGAADVYSEVTKGVLGELGAELQERRTPLIQQTLGMVLNFAAGLTPAGLAVQSLSEVRAIVRERNSWVSLLRSGDGADLP